MATQHYSLRWNNHQTHVLHAFDTLLQNETLVDVTLVCEETRVRAHKVVLSACSPFFQRIFSENPCKHPVIILKDLRRWEVQGIVDFMYKGEISVAQEHLTSLIKAAESLQVRGLAHTEEREPGAGPEQPADTSTAEGAAARGSDGVARVEEGGSGEAGGPCLPKVLSPFCPSPLAALEPPRLLPSLAPPSAHPPPSALPCLPFEDAPEHSPPAHLRPASHLAPTASLPPPYAAHAAPPPPPSAHAPPPAAPPSMEHHRSSPLPRRKQARPRRRSGELVPQDLSKPGQATCETPENLSMKKSLVNSSSAMTEKGLKCEAEECMVQNQKGAQTECSQFPTPSLMEGPVVDSRPLSMTTNDRVDYSNCAAESISLPPLPSDSSMDGTPYPQIPSVSSLAMTPPQAFNPESQHIGFFSPMDTCQNPLLNEILPETRIENHVLGKRKLGRPKGQHSAPRGGPPRSWTNSELTEALHNVWNKRMTTSQASRIFGIPYNSLLMYVRGKYGKSLKLEQLKKNCLVGGGRGGPLQGTDLLPPVLPLGRGQPYPMVEGDEGGGTSRAELEAALPLDPYAQLYSDFGSFPIPVGMIHLLPQSEKNRELPMELAGPEKQQREKKRSGKRRAREERLREERGKDERSKEERAEKVARAAAAAAVAAAAAAAVAVVEDTKEKMASGEVSLVPDAGPDKVMESEVMMKMKEEYQKREGGRGMCETLAEIAGQENERRVDPMVCD
ncbi:protein jim lovell-like [Hetaerina americana]|uniref:protein jim lovell-like n=1 Tax=Hetaerina americana TaxID=62018 RepID=UPI003A7F4792